ncbi:MAG: hypothetical protein JO187_07105, partial [Acidobacteria bacterium]|nr:hypothetical protein [Acidobacteriota bacterium]
MIRSRLVRFVLRVAVYCLPALAALRLDIVADPDMWWHTRIGQWIVQHGTVPVTDPFSSFGAGKTWFAYSWAFDLLLYNLQQRFGLVGYVGYVAVCTLAISIALFTLIERIEPRFSRSSVITAAGLFVLVPLYTPRSWLITIFFYLLLLHVLLSYWGGRRRVLLLLPPLFFLWANVHIQFVYGLVVLVLASVAPRLQTYVQRRHSLPMADMPQDRERVWDIPKILMACILATFVNPYGIWLYRTVAVYARQHTDLIEEMQPLKIHAVSEWVFLALLLFAVFALGWRRQLQVFPVLLLAFGVLAAFKAERDLWVAALPVLWILADAGEDHRAGLPAQGGTRMLAVGASVVVIVVIIAARHLSQGRLQEYVTTRFPAKAVSVVAREHYPGPLFNDYDWGGYLIWTLPQLPVAIDGRMDVQGDAHFKQTWDTWMAAPEWSADPQLRAANLVIANKKLPLTSLLRLDPQFEVVYEDDV